MMTTTAEPAARLSTARSPTVTRTSAGAAGPLPRLGPGAAPPPLWETVWWLLTKRPLLFPGNPAARFHGVIEGLETVFLRKAARLTATLLTAAKAWTPRDVPQEDPTLVPPD